MLILFSCILYWITIINSSKGKKSFGQYIPVTERSCNKCNELNKTTIFAVKNSKIILKTQITIYTFSPNIWIAGDKQIVGVWHENWTVLKFRMWKFWPGNRLSLTRPKINGRSKSPVQNALRPLAANWSSPVTFLFYGSIESLSSKVTVPSRKLFYFTSGETEYSAGC
jgi:hypothetical protein